MNQPLRLSPSGRYITNGNGGQFNPGPGAVLRLNEAIAAGFPVSAAANIPTAAAAEATQVICEDGIGTGGTTMAAELALPSPNLNYRVTGVLDLLSSTSAIEEVTVYLDISNDEGATWHTQATNVHTVVGGGRQARIDLRSVPGANIGVAEGDLALLARLRVSLPAVPGGGTTVRVDNPTDTGTPQGTLLLQLYELF